QRQQGVEGYYDLEIARHLARGDGLTFDGRHPTSGFQPLWVLLLAALYAPLELLTASTPAMRLVVALLAQTLCVAAALAALVRLLRRPIARGGADASPWMAAVAVAVWLAIESVYAMGVSGLEYALQTLILALLLARAARPDDPLDGARLRALGWLGALATLTRFDNALLIALVGAHAAWTAGRRAADSGARVGAVSRALLTIGLPSLLALAGWSLVLWQTTGAPLPTSGTVKMAWSASRLAADPHVADGWLVAKLHHAAQLLGAWPWPYRLGWWTGLVGGVALAIAWRDRPLGRALVPFAGFAIAQTLAYLIVFHGGYAFVPWYYPLMPLLAALAVTAALAAVVERVRDRRIGRALAALLVVALALYALRAHALRGARAVAFAAQEPLRAAAAWTAAVGAPSLADGEAIGAWNAGLIAYLNPHAATRPVINLDGLVNAPDFHADHRAAPCAYLARANIRLLVDVGWPATDDPAGPFAPYGADLRACADRLVPAWTGPADPRQAGRRAVAYRVRPRAAEVAP
ncbi:MAG: hypothetical protein AAF772_12760, partial [Acidobacteriota bacterium]